MTTSTHLHWYDPLCAHAAIEDLADFVSPATSTSWTEQQFSTGLGLILGLDYNQLKAMMDPKFVGIAIFSLRS